MLEDESSSVLEISTDNISYKTDDTITISGTIPSDVGMINVTLLDPDGNTVTVLNATGSSGSFLITLDANLSLFNTPGTYTASIDKNNLSSETTFNYNLVISAGSSDTSMPGFTPGADDTLGIGETVIGIVSKFNFNMEPLIPYPADASVIKHLYNIGSRDTTSVPLSRSLFDIDSNDNLITLSRGYVSDENRQLSKYDTSGNLLDESLIKLDGAQLTHLEIDSDGILYLPNTNWGISKFNQDGTLLSEIYPSSSISRIVESSFFVMDSKDNIFAFADNWSPDVSYGSINPENFIVKLSKDGELLASIPRNDVKYLVVDEYDNLYSQNFILTTEYEINDRTIRTAQKITVEKFDNNLNSLGSLQKEYSLISLHDNHRPERLIGADSYGQLYFAGKTSNIDQMYDVKIVGGALMNEIEVFMPINGFNDLELVGTLQRYQLSEMSQFSYRYDTLWVSPENSLIPDSLGNLYLLGHGIHVFNPPSIGNEILIRPNSSYQNCSEWESNWVGRDTPYRAFNCVAPFNARINTGDALTWINQDDSTHILSAGTPDTGSNGLFDSPVLSAGDSFSITFDSPGVYEYFDTLHPWVKGIVTVIDG